MVGMAQFPDHAALPIVFQRGARLEARPGLEAVQVLHDLAAIEQMAVIEEMRVQAGPVRHLPAVHDLAGHVDQIDRAVAVHRREQRIARLCQGRVVRDKAGACAPDLLLVDARHACLPRCYRAGSNLPNPSVSSQALYRGGCREEDPYGTCRPDVCRGVLVAAGRSTLLVERLSLALHALSAPLLARAILVPGPLLSSAVLLRLVPAILLPARVHALAALLGINSLVQLPASEPGVPGAAATRNSLWR